MTHKYIYGERDREGETQRDKKTEAATERQRQKLTECT